MPSHEPDQKVAARGSRARQRLLRRLANLDVDELRNIPRETVVVLVWQDIVDLIALRHRIRTPEEGTIAYCLVRHGGRIGRALDRVLAKIKKMGTKR